MDNNKKNVYDRERFTFIKKQRKEEEIHMKVLKRLSAVLLTLCLMLSLVPAIDTYAADGSIVFSDPETKVGENVEVKGVIRTTGGAAIGDADITMNYDSSALEFVSGDNVRTERAGEIVYSGKGTGEETELSFMMTFKVLKEGQSQITIADYTAYLYSDETLTCQEGTSTVTAKPGDGTASGENQTAAAGSAVTVNGAQYTISGSFSDSDIPTGFSKAEMTYENSTVPAVKQDTSEQYAVYLVDQENKGKFFLYDPEGKDEKFYPLAQVIVSERTNLIFLQNDGSVKLPEQYEETTMKIDDMTFPAWQNTKEDGIFLLYALNNNGQKALYQYDNNEDTYQRFTDTASQAAVKQETKVGKLETLMRNYPIQVMISVAIAFFVLLVIIIILAVKLRHRNLELDELYDEYHIDEDDDSGEKSLDGAYPEEEEDYGGDEPTDVFSDEYDDDFDEYDLEDQAAYADESDDILKSKYEDEYEEYEDLDGDSDYEYDSDDYHDYHKSKKDSENFNVDFIDLD